MPPCLPLFAVQDSLLCYDEVPEVMQARDQAPYWWSWIVCKLTTLSDSQASSMHWIGYFLWLLFQQPRVALLSCNVNQRFRLLSAPLLQGRGMDGCFLTICHTKSQ